MKSNLGELIAFLLRSNNRVSLPGMGAFVAKYQPAIIDEETLVISPPSKEISFSKAETWNDQLLEKLIAEREKISLEDASVKTIQLVKEIQNVLDKDGQYIFENFGILVKDDWEYNVIIEDNLNLLPDAFGLEPETIQPAIPKKEIKITPIENTSATITSQSQNTPTKPIATPISSVKRRKKNTGFLWIGIIVIVAITCTLLYLYTNLFSTIHTSSPVPSNNLATFQPDSSASDTSKVDTAEVANVEQVINTQTEKKKALYYEEPKNSSNAEKIFYIIAGSFTKMENAERLKSSLEKKGFKPEILTVDGPVYRVSMFSFTNRNRALEELTRLREENKQMNIWLLGL